MIQQNKTGKLPDGDFFMEINITYTIEKFDMGFKVYKFVHGTVHKTFPETEYFTREEANKFKDRVLLHGETP